MNTAGMIAKVFWVGMLALFHPAPAKLENGCFVTFLAYRDVIVRYQGYELPMHHMATVRCDETYQEFDVRQDGNRLDVTPIVTR